MKVSTFFVAMVLSFSTFCSHALGDLFTSSSQRQLIDTLRERKGAEWLAQPQAAGVLKINGFYYKSQPRKSKKVLWLNGQQIPVSGSFPGGSTRHLNQHDKTVAIKLDGTQRSLSFKAGQKLHLDQLNVVDAYQ